MDKIFDWSSLSSIFFEYSKKNFLFVSLQSKLKYYIINACLIKKIGKI